MVRSIAAKVSEAEQIWDGRESAGERPNNEQGTIRGTNRGPDDLMSATCIDAALGSLAEPVYRSLARGQRCSTRRSVARLTLEERAS